jgi:hypothetical protein
MRVEHLELLVEEPSMEMALRALLPKIVGSTSFEVYSHQVKHELLSRLPNSWRIVVIVDRDDEDCTRLKARLEQIAADAKLTTRSGAEGKPYVVVNRIAIEELEAWYFGDWEAVRASYPRVPGTIPTKGKYRDPDAIPGGTWEAFERELQQAGYFAQGLAKIEAARTIAAHMSPERNTSRSFQVLREALAEMATP